MAYKITGTVLAVSQPFNITSPKTGNTITKRDLIITVRLFDQYTGQPTEDSGNTPKFTFIGDRCRDLDLLKEGDIVTVDFEVSGRSYEKEGRTEYFTEVRPFRCYTNRQQPPSAAPQQQPQPTPYQQPMEQQPLQAAQPQSMQRNSDLPF